MIRLIPYIFPILVNYVCGGVFFITSLRCSQAGAPGWVVGATVSTWSLVYSVVSFFIGRKVTEKNTVKLIAAAGLMIFGASMGFLVFSGLYTQFIWIALTGIATATYCTSFQVFAKSIEKNSNTGIVRATSLYTISWSLGMATGPLIFGVLPGNSGFYITGLIGLVIAAGIIAASRVCARQNNAADSSTVQTSSASESKAPGFKDFVLVGWIVGGTGTIAIFVLRNLVPYRATLLDFTQSDTGFVLATVSFVQAFMALALIRSKTMMYKKLPLFLAGSSGVSALLLFGYGSNLCCFAAAAVLFGLYSGYFYFMFVYHSLISPVNSTRNVAVNEIIVGLTGTFGPVIGGLLTSPQNSSTAFTLSATFCAASIIFAAVYFYKKNSVSNGKETCHCS